MQVTREQKEKGKEISGKSKCTVYVNESGEFFTSQNLASLSVNGNKEKYAIAYDNK